MTLTERTRPNITAVPDRPEHANVIGFLNRHVEQGEQIRDLTALLSSRELEISLLEMKNQYLLSELDKTKAELAAFQQSFYKLKTDIGAVAMTAGDAIKLVANAAIR